MAGLRSLLEYSQPGLTIANKPVRILRVYDTATTTANNGGGCCLWTVPADTNWVGIEMWGGGGGGAGGCCNFQGWPGGAGVYVRKILPVAPGQEYTICAGGSTGFTRSTGGLAGNGSYMCRTDAICISAGGGSPGITRCGFSYGGTYDCYCMNYDGATSQNATLAFGSQFGWARPGANRQYYTQIIQGAPYAHPNPQITRNACSTCCGGGVIGLPKFPATGGASVQMSACGACYCGGFGAGGLVNLYYMSDDTP